MRINHKRRKEREHVPGGLGGYDFLVGAARAGLAEGRQFCWVEP